MIFLIIAEDDDGNGTNLSMQGWEITEHEAKWWRDRMGSPVEVMADKAWINKSMELPGLIVLEPTNE